MSRVQFRMMPGLVCLLAFLVGSAVMAVIIPQSVDQLTANSTDIVRGTVVSQESAWNGDRTFISTTVTIEIADIYKGGLNTTTEVTVSTPGGTVGDTNIWVEHAPTFSTGQEVIVFLDQSDGTYRVTSWEMGKYSVENDQVLEKSQPVSVFVESIREAVRQEE